jgi:hypothetical protein
MPSLLGKQGSMAPRHHLSAGEGRGHERLLAVALLEGPQFLGVLAEGGGEDDAVIGAAAFHVPRERLEAFVPAHGRRLVFPILDRSDGGEVLGVLRNHDEFLRVGRPTEEDGRNRARPRRHSEGGGVPRAAILKQSPTTSIRSGPDGAFQQAEGSRAVNCLSTCPIMAPR